MSCDQHKDLSQDLCELSSNKQICFICKTNKHIYIKRNGNGFCRLCYDKFIRQKEKCIICGNYKVTHVRDKEGNSICSNCYCNLVKPKEICAVCCELEKVHVRKNNEPMCHKCYVKSITREKMCSCCNKIKKICGKRDICKNCYKKTRQPKHICKSCGQLSIIKNKKCGFCPTCYKQKAQQKYECSVCGQLKIANQWVNNKPICSKCYKMPIEICSMCGKTKQVWRRLDNKPLCMRCNVRHKLKTDDNFYKIYLIRKRFKEGLKKYAVTGISKVSKKYGIDYKKIADHLGPCPGKRGEYHIDHIFPISAFDFSKKEHIIAAFAPENHRWLEKHENLSKKDKYNECEFLEYLKKYVK